MPETSSTPRPLVNCHTHIFTGDHVPPWLARTFVPWPFYFLLPLWLIVSVYRWWFAENGPGNWPYKPWYKRLKRMSYSFWILVNRIWIIFILHNLLGIVLTWHVLYFIWDWCGSLIPATAPGWMARIQPAWDWMAQNGLLWTVEDTWSRIFICVLLLALFRSGRNLLLFILKRVIRLFIKLPGKQTAELLKRYLTIGRFAYHREQRTILGTLTGQYPRDMKFVILPMDMEYMAAGKPRVSYTVQMEKLAELKLRGVYKDKILPFVFADPRRIEADPTHFSYHMAGGKIVLDDCFVKRYIEEYGFSGFKIYPALGYYPFDDLLLPLWKYAADNNIPILTHCIRGTIFYRGPKRQEWDRHPVFMQAMGEGRYEPMLLPEKKNKDFSVNFTHPLNYLCLLDKDLLTGIVRRNEKLWEVFGYDHQTGKMASDLSHLKLCFGHFGGDDEWNRFLESDRGQFAPQLFKEPRRGIEFLKKADGTPAPGKPEQLWKGVDWYTIICSMMLQYRGVYADISYILHDAPAVLPLLRQTLTQDGLKEKVLYGTDFYVVRNHRSDKDMHACIRAGLSEEEYNMIARDNPHMYLHL